MGTQALSKQVSIQDFVSELRKFPEPTFDRTDQITKFLESMLVAPESLTPYLTWDRQHYTRNLIDKTPLYELIAICWEVGQGSSVHNHRDQNCWMAVPMGRLLVENYRVVDQKLEEGTCELETADTVRNELRPIPAPSIPSSPCIASTIHGNSIRERSVCTCTPVRSIPAWCIRRSSTLAERSSSITTPSMARRAGDFGHLGTSGRS